MNKSIERRSSPLNETTVRSADKRSENNIISRRSSDSAAQAGSSLPQEAATGADTERAISQLNTRCGDAGVGSTSSSSGISSSESGMEEAISAAGVPVLPSPLPVSVSASSSGQHEDLEPLLEQIKKSLVCDEFLKSVASNDASYAAGSSSLPSAVSTRFALATNFVDNLAIFKETVTASSAASNSNTANNNNNNKNLNSSNRENSGVAFASANSTEMSATDLFTMQMPRSQQLYNRQHPQYSRMLALPPSSPPPPHTDSDNQADDERNEDDCESAENDHEQVEVENEDEFEIDDENNDDADEDDHKCCNDEHEDNDRRVAHATELNLSSVLKSVELQNNTHNSNEEAHSDKDDDDDDDNDEDDDEEDEINNDDFRRVNPHRKLRFILNRNTGITMAQRVSIDDELDDDGVTLPHQQLASNRLSTTLTLASAGEETGTSATATEQTQSSNISDSIGSDNVQTQSQSQNNNSSSISSINNSQRSHLALLSSTGNTWQRLLSLRQTSNMSSRSSQSSISTDSAPAVSDTVLMVAPASSHRSELNRPQWSDQQAQTSAQPSAAAQAQQQAPTTTLLPLTHRTDGNVRGELVKSVDGDTTSRLSSPSMFHFKDTASASRILDGLNRQRAARHMCDVVLVVRGDEYHCHRCVLTALSPYFGAMFGTELAESKQARVDLSHALGADDAADPSATVRALVDYAYTASMCIQDVNVQSLLVAANLFDIKSVKAACCRYMEWQMDESNVIGIHCFAETHDCTDLTRVSFKYICDHFTKVCSHDEFVALPLRKLIEIVSTDTLNASNEETVFRACVRWLNQSSSERQLTFYQRSHSSCCFANTKVLEHVRLPLLSAYFLYDQVYADERLCKTCARCSALVQEATMYHLLKDRRGQMQNERTRSRCFYQELEALVIVGDEDDSVVLRSADSYFPAIDRWLPLQCCPYALSKHGVVASEEAVLYLGGGEMPSGDPNDSFWQYNSVTDEWKELTPMLTQRSELGMAIVDGCVYAIGGLNQETRLASVERYEPRLNQWAPCASMRLAVSSVAVCALNGLLYVAGGSHYDIAMAECHGNGSETVGGAALDLFQAYEPAADAWLELAAMRTCRSGAAACALNGRVYVLGGYGPAVQQQQQQQQQQHCNNSEQGSVDIVGRNDGNISCEMRLMDVYEPLSDTWHRCPDMLERRHKPGVSVLNGLVYVCGGRASTSVYHDSIEAFDELTQTWTYVTTMTSARSWLACAALRLATPLAVGSSGDATDNADVEKSEAIHSDHF